MKRWRQGKQMFNEMGHGVQASPVCHTIRYERNHHRTEKPSEAGKAPDAHKCKRVTARGKAIDSPPEQYWFGDLKDRNQDTSSR